MSLDGGGRTVVAAVAAPAAAMDSTSVFWWNSVNGDVQFAPIGGGTIQPLSLAQTSDTATTGIAVDTSNVYFALGGTAANGFTDGVVIAQPKVGGTSATLASGRSGLRGVTVAGGTVYWADGAGVMSAPLDGGTIATVAADTQNVLNVVVDGTEIYWSNSSSILKASLDGGAPVTVTANANVYGLNGLAVDSTSVYWTGAGAIDKITPK